MDVTSFRGTHRLEPAELQKGVLQLLQHEDSLRGVAEQDLRVSTATLLNMGIGLRPTPGPGEGYRQVLALYAATLLKYAGATESAIDAEVGSRDQARLEGLVQAVRTRLAQLAELGEPGSAVTNADVFERMPTEAEPSKTVSVAGMASPFFAPETASVQAVEDNPALAFVKALLTPEVMSLVNQAPPMDGQMQVRPGHRITAEEHAVPSATRRAQAVSMAEPVELEVAPGVLVKLSAEALVRYQDPAHRAALIRALALEFDRVIQEAQ